MNQISTFSTTSIRMEELNSMTLKEETLEFIQSFKQIPLTSLEFFDATINQIQAGSDHFDDNSLQLSIKQINSNSNVKSEKNAQKKGCICKKTKCLKMYCQCFASGKKCTDLCVCYGCSNDDSHCEQVQKAKASIEDRKNLKGNKHAGCNCRKSECQKKYCQCFNAGRACTQLCKCSGCLNCQSSFQPSDLKNSQELI